MVKKCSMLRKQESLLCKKHSCSMLKKMESIQAINEWGTDPYMDALDDELDEIIAASKAAKSQKEIIQAQSDAAKEIVGTTHAIKWTAPGGKKYNSHGHILKYLQDNGSATLYEIADASGLSRHGLHTTAMELLAAKYIVVDGNKGRAYTYKATPTGMDVKLPVLASYPMPKKPKDDNSLGIYSTTGYRNTTVVIANSNNVENKSSKITCQEDLEKLLKLHDKPDWAFVISLDGENVNITAEGIGRWDGNIFSGSEGAFYVGKESRLISHSRFLAVNVKDAASYALTLLVPMLEKKTNKKSGVKYTPSKYVNKESYIQWRRATEEEESDPNIIWTQEGSSKYGRRMINKDLGIWRPLNFGEFYGSSVVD